MKMRLVLSILIAVSCGATAADDAERYLGQWTYRGDDALLSVQLQPGGECEVVAVLPYGRASRMVRCSYVADGSDITIMWRHQVDGLIPPPSHLTLSSDQSVIRVEGEASRVLERRGVVLWMR